jgi:hypothetical protein
MKYNILKTVAVIFCGAAVAGGLQGAPPSAEDVGDAGSFGHAALYMGADSGFITLAPVCDPEPAPVPPETANDFQCFTLNPAPAPTHFEAEDICRIKLPKKATKTIIYPALNFFINYQLRNTTGVDQPLALFAFTATLTIESDALLDPSIIDPQTTLPANGKLVNQFTYVYRDDRRMEDGDRQRQRMTLVRVGNAGINKAQLISQGLSPAVVDALFDSAMTIRMSVSGDARLTTDANITGNMRLFGD